MTTHAGNTSGKPSAPGQYPISSTESQSSSGKLNKFGTYVQTNPTGVRVLGAIGGVGLTAVSIMACFAIFNSFLSPLTYIQNIFFLVFGVAISVVSILPNSIFAEAIYGQAHFMSTLHGRAFFFLYLGALLFGAGFSGSTASWVYLLIGTWMLLTAAIYFYLKCRGGNDSSLGGSQV
jgi:hypothetical protein